MAVDTRDVQSGQLPSSEFRTSAPEAIEERVRLANDQDVADFVQRILNLIDEPGGQQALSAGQHRFRLAEKTQHKPDQAACVPNGNISRVEHGLLTERECGRLAPAVKLLVIGASVRVTPLASDWLRRKGITIKRAES